MADVSNALMYKVLKWLQDNQINMQESLTEVKAELRAIGGPMVATQADIANLYTGQAKIELRLERIGKRLELADTHV